MTASGYASGLTVYLWHEQITGIASHGIGSSDFLFGSRSGIPNHFALNQGEQLISAWLHEYSLVYGVVSTSKRYLVVTSPFHVILLRFQNVSLQLERLTDFL